MHHEGEDGIDCPETYSISVKQIMPFLLDMQFKEIKEGVKPSVVIAALKLTCEERLEKLRNPTRKYKTGSKTDTFSRCPEAIIFQNFKTGVSYTTPLTITNQKTVPENIAICFESSRHFTLSMNNRINHQTRLAPGMSYTVYITFLPTDAHRDYVRELRIMGDIECYVVPVYGFGPRPLAHMPDKIVLPPTLVKVQSTSTVIVKNTGSVSLGFVSILDKPFSSDIVKAIVPSKGILEVKYYCYPTRTGYICGKLKTYFKNELCVATDLECEVHSSRIELERQIITFKDVFMGLSRKSTLRLHNSSEYTFNFSWKMFNEEEEQQEYKRLMDLMTEMKDYQLPQYKKLEYLEILDGEAHAEIYKRILEDETKELLSNQRDKFLYNSSSFEIIPKVGKVLPKSIFEFVVIFSPHHNTIYNSSAYLDIEGTEKRIRVSLNGCGIGPPVMLCVRKINASQIYLTDKHQYELAVKNKGVIAATVTYQPKNTDWGGVIDCIPHTLSLGPDCTQAFIILFYSDVQGDFLETLDFIVEESRDYLQCVFMGSVVCPLLKCVPKSLEFGTVSVEMTHTKELFLVNDSRVVIGYEIEIKQLLREVLEIIPSSGKVKPNSQTQLRVRFSAAVLSTWNEEILLIMWKSKQYTKVIPFSCICSCPRIIATPDMIRIKFCFLNCEYLRTIKLENQSNLCGYVEYQQKSDGHAIRCTPMKTRGFLDSHATMEIVLKIVVTALGPHELPLYFAIVGAKPEKLCTIYCNGQGPVISYYPDEVHFGKIELLKKSTQILSVVNDSPIMAKVRVYCKNKSQFYIENEVLELASEQTLDVPVIANLNNAGKIRDTINLEITDSGAFAIKVSGEGVGTSIVCDPPLFPKLDLGNILTYKNFSKEISLTNKGSSTHKLFFSKRPMIKNLKEEEESQIATAFNIVPLSVELEADKEAKITIKCSSKKPRSIEEEYYCHAVIGKAVVPQLLKAFLIKAEFVDPQLDFSKTEFNFNINVNGSSTDGTVQDLLKFDNRTGVSIVVMLTVDESFGIWEGSGSSQHIIQEVSNNSEVTKEIKYCPNITEKRRRKQRGRIVFEYENHPKTDIINLFGEVMFPTIKLSPFTVDFHCVPLGSTSYMTVVIQNVSNMVVSFKWLWLEKSIKIFDLNPSTIKASVVKIHDKNPRQKLMEYIDFEKKVVEEVNSDSISQENNIDIAEDTEALDASYSNERYLDEMRKVLFPLLTPYSEKNEQDFHRITPKPADSHDISKWLALEPSEGTLEPNEYSLITIGFSPPPNTEIKATAICKILGGEEEELFVMGKSTKICYKLDKKNVNFGNQIFCEICTNDLTLTNNGLCCFRFKVIVEESLSGQPEMLDISPLVGTLTPGKNVKFKIDYFPGYPGRFEKPFALEIGYLEPVTINVHGYAVVNQIFLHVPRLDMKLSAEDSYKALAWITPEYLENVQRNDTKDVMEDDVPIDPSGFLKENDWTYVSYNEQYPSLMDINMAMERILALNHVLENKTVLKDHTEGKNRIPYIPNFTPAPYCVDFEYTSRDVPVCYTVLIYNYGPTKAEVKLLENNKSALLEKEFKIEYKEKVMLPGDMTELFILFSPTIRRCKTLNIKLEDIFCLSVSHGPIITVQIKAEVTLPCVMLSCDSIHFERVYCGDVLRKTKVLKNYGNVVCKWFASVTKSFKKGMIPNFFLVPKEGELEPGEETYLNVYFAPTVSQRIKRIMQIDVEGNSSSIFVDLFGESLETILQIVPIELKFPPTLSFFDATAYFSIQNMSSVPVKIYFPTLDTTEENEKTMIQLYLTYKNLRHVYIPFRSAAEELPDFFTATYKTLVENLRKKMKGTSVVDEGTEEKPTYGSTMNLPQDGIEVEDPLAKYSPEELNAILMEYISAEGFENDFSTKATTYQFEETTDLIEIVEPEKKLMPEPSERSAVLLIFHGAPTTDYYKAATQAGIGLRFPVYSVDRLIIESLIESSHPCAVDIVGKINENFEEHAAGDLDLLSLVEREDNEYDEILTKITIILTTKPKKGSKKPSGKEKSSKASVSEKSQGKTKGGSVNTDCFLNILPENIVDILRLKLKQFPCLIIESLNSTFLPKENLCLYTILKGAGAVQHIQLVILSHTVDEYVTNELAKLQASTEENSPLDKIKSQSQHNSPTKKSTKAESEKKSKGSPPLKKARETADMKKILQNLGKNLKMELEHFEDLRREIIFITDYWDRKNANLRKPFNEKTSSKREPVNKDSSRTIKSSVKRQASAATDEEDSLNLSELGLHLWIVLNSAKNRPIDFCEMIRNRIVTDWEIQKTLEDIRHIKEPVFEEFDTVFSVISKPSGKTNALSPVFFIRNFKGKGSCDSLRSRSKSASSDNKPRRRRSSRSSRKSSDSKISVRRESAFPKTIPPEKDFEFSTKAVLNPEDCIKYQVTFMPIQCGKYSQTYTVESTKMQHAYKIVCNAVCEYPKFDVRPEVMFPKVLDNYRDKASYDHFVFIRDQRIFDFGSVIVGNNKDKSYTYTSSPILRNITTSVCEVSVSLSNDYFYAESDKITIRPKSEEKVKLCIKPTEAGTVTSEVFLSIKGNPQVVSFTLACTPCKFDFHVSPKTIAFEKVPVSYKAKRIVKITNSSPINLRWEFVEIDWNNGIFDISAESGYVGLYSVRDIAIHFKPKEEMSIPKKPLQIRVYDVNGSSEPCYTDTLMIHADSVEYNLEVQSLIDYGEIKGGVDSKYSFPIHNKGKCEVVIMISLIDNPLEQTNFARKFFRISPQMLTLGAQKTENVSVIFHPTCTFSVENILLFVINMVESVQSGHVVKFYTVNTSATVFMPSYKLCPHNEMNFGHVPLLGIKKMILEISNTGRFSFSFTLQEYEKFLTSLEKSSPGRKSVKEKGNIRTEEKGTAKKKETKNESKLSKGTQSSKVLLDKKKLKLTKLELDGFTLTPSSGIVEPNQRLEIEMEFAPREIKEYYEDILLNILEIEDIQKKKIYTLKAFGCEPRLNLRNFENIFVEQYIVANLDDFIEPRNIESYCVFVSSEVAMHFKLVCINNTKTVQLHIKNIGFVSANMSAKVDDFGKNIFSVSPTNRKIDSYSACDLEVTFKPDSLEVFRGTLEISYNASADNKLLVQLIGQACLPQIKLLNPIAKNNVANLNFGPLCVGHEKMEKISFKNVGLIKCKVVVEIVDSDGVFQIVPGTDTIEKINVQVDESETRNHIMVNLLPEEIAEFEVTYKPIKQQCIPVTLNLHIIFNPFEVNKILLNADSYDDDIVIEGLQAFKLDDGNLLRSSISRNVIAYYLDLGNKELNRLTKSSFIIRNRSKIHTFKFKFCNPPFTFIPEVGHLKPKAFKEILVVFKSNEPILKKKEEIQCNLCKIEYVTPDNDPLSWDDRQKFVYWVVERHNSTVTRDSEWATIFQDEIMNNGGMLGHYNELEDESKCFRSSTTTNTGKPSEVCSEIRETIEEGTEPQFTTLPDSNNILSIFLSVAADYSKYICETDEIRFWDTYIKETCVKKFEVKNTGTVPLSITWNVVDINFTPSIKRSSSSFLFRSDSIIASSSLHSNSASSLCSTGEVKPESIPFPFEIDPVKSIIEPGQAESFNVIFSPETTEAYNGSLKSNIEALDPDCKEMCINVSGQPLPKPFYFEYNDGRTASKDLVINFESVGDGAESTSYVLLVNPHDDPISFEIVSEYQKEFICFVCETPKGNIKGKKKSTVSFVFEPPTFGSFKAFYLLKIPEKNISTKILLVGVCRPPKVYFSETLVVLKPTVPKVKTLKSLELVNDEVFPLSFKFIKKSLFDETQQEKLEIHPIVGKLKPKSKSDIRISFITSNIITMKFHVKCMVEKFRSPISLPVSASCIEIEPLVKFTDKRGTVVYLNKNEVNIIDLGQTHKGKKDILEFQILNEGQTGMFYAWKLDRKPVCHMFNISIDSDKGFVKKGNYATSSLQLEALRVGQLKQFKINLDIMYGPNYIIQLNAIAEKPIYSFSFHDYNFGPCFLQKGVTQYYNTILSFKNLDSHPILLENLFDNTNYLTVNFISSYVSPGSSRNIRIAFHPQKVGLYQSNISFMLGSIEEIIPISGEGTEISLELVYLRDKFINFGEVLVDTPKKYKVCVVNNSLARIDVHFSLFENLVIFQRKTASLETTDVKMPLIESSPTETSKGKDNKKKDKATDTKLDKQKTDKKNSNTNTNTTNKDKKQEKEIESNKQTEVVLKQEEERKELIESFAIIPNMFIDIPPHGKGQFEIIFQPKTRTSFEEKVYFETQDYFEPICIVKGSGLCPEFSLDRTDLLFSGVIINCNKTHLVTLKNTGDIIGSFNWTINDRRNVFDIEPKQGFVMPNNDMKIKITFSPKQEKCEYKVKAKCTVKEYKEPLHLLLKGNSLKVPEPKETVVFNCIVREQAVQPVILTNTTSDLWIIQPEVHSSNGNFSTPKEITAPALADTQLNITYAPKSMTRSKPDEGSLFLKLPTGGGILYKLIGNANPPAIKKRIEKEVYCKQNSYVTLPIENWLDVKQSFHVITEVISPITIKTVFKLLGMKSTELGGNQSKNYRWGVYIFNEEPIECRVTFKNPETGEYLFYEISLKVLPAQTMGTIDFGTNVREPLTKQFTLDNPVDVPITFILDCSERNLTFEKSVTLQPYTKTKVDLTYTPLRKEDTCTVLSVRCEELGMHSYSIMLHADSPKPENIVLFKAELGDKAVKTISFKNVFDRVVEFAFTFDNSEFYVEKYAQILPNETSKILIAFDPCALGPLKSKLFLNSAVAGEYIYPLEGEGVSPTPKGPFSVRLNNPTAIEFKNPFIEERTFIYQIQPNVFHAEPNEEIIKPKKSTRILVSIGSLTDTVLSCPITGKLTICTPDEPELEWTYYLLFNQS